MELKGLPFLVAITTRISAIGSRWL